MKETLTNHSDSARDEAEVISAIRYIQNKDEIFAALTRNSEAMNRAGIRFSAEDGQIKLDGIVVDMNEFIALNNKRTETYISNLSHQRFSQQRAPANTSTNAEYNISFKTVIIDFLSDIHIDTTEVNINQVVVITNQFLGLFSGDSRTKILNAVRQVRSHVLSKLSRTIINKIDGIIPKELQYYEFLRLGISFFGSLVDEWEEVYRTYEQTKDLKYYRPIFERVNPVYVKRTIELFEYVVQNSYFDEMVSGAALRRYSGYTVAWITRIIFENEQRKECEKMRLRHSAGFKVKRINCSVCGGYYFGPAE